MFAGVDGRTTLFRGVVQAFPAEMKVFSAADGAVEEVGESQEADGAVLLGDHA